MPLRERFPIFQSRTYFDSCSHGALSDEVRQAYLSYLDDRDSFGSPLGSLGGQAGDIENHAGAITERLGR